MTVYNNDLNLDDLSDEEKLDFKKNMSFFFSGIVNMLDTMDTDSEKIKWIKEMEHLFRENINDGNL